MAELRSEQKKLPLAARETLGRWKAKDRERFVAFWELAKSRLQRELLERSLVAGRLVSELNAFAEAIRGMKDDALFAACFEVDPELGADGAFEQRLRAEADPMDGFGIHRQAERATQSALPMLRASTLKPALAGSAEADTAPRASSTGLFPLTDLGESSEVARLTPLRPERTVSQVTAPRPKVKKPARPVQRAGSSRESSVTEVGSRGRPGPPVPDEQSYSRIPGARSEEVLNDALDDLGLKLRERAVDGRFKLETALDRAAKALEKGIPIPVVLGAEPGQFTAYALFLQVLAIGGRRAFQLHDPFGRTTVWVAEKDLLGRKQLPGMDRTRRRVTAISLP